MIREIQAKTLLSYVRQPDTVFGLKYNLNLYRGCQHQCIYCDSRSECYGIADFRDVLVKVNAIELLEKELSRKRIKGSIGFGSMSDTYAPVEAEYQLTRRALQVIARFRFPVHIITKSDLVLRDADLLTEINRQQARVCFTITTADDELGKKVEPGAPLVSRRYAAMAQLAQQGIPVGITLMPVLPFIEDNPENITAIVEKAAENGVSFIIAWMGMSMRDRQREWYYNQLDRSFPGLRQKYEQRFGSQYGCPANQENRLWQVFHALCARHGIATQVPPYIPPDNSAQLTLPFHGVEE
jgi:DNA repair photolyase